MHVWTAPKLKVLNVSHNRLEVLGGEEVARAVQLRELDASHNSLVEFPAELATLPRLREVNMDANKVVELPADVVWSDALRIVSLTGTALETLPVSLLRGSKVSTLRFEDTPLFERQRFYELDGFDEFVARRKERVDKGIQGGVRVDLGS